MTPTIPLTPYGNISALDNQGKADVQEILQRKVEQISALREAAWQLDIEYQELLCAAAQNETHKEWAQPRFDIAEAHRLICRDGALRIRRILPEPDISFSKWMTQQGAKKVGDYEGAHHVKSGGEEFVVLLDNQKVKHIFGKLV